MENKFIENLSAQLQKNGYLTEGSPVIPGVQALLYAYSPEPFRLGFAKVEDHFLFIDWENAVFKRLDLLLLTHQNFSKHVNRNFPMPHALRLLIPNLAIIAISQTEFPDEVIRYAGTTYLDPWYGGEAGQIMLINLHKKEIFCHSSPGYRRSGALPLSHAVEIIKTVCKPFFLSKD